MKNFTVEKAIWGNVADGPSQYYISESRHLFIDNVEDANRAISTANRQLL